MINKKARRNRASNTANSRKAQSALEYLLTYSWSILLVSIIIAIIYFFVVTPQTIVSSACVFSTGAYCKDLVFGSNAVSSTVSMVLTNTWSYPVMNPQIQINVSGVPVTPGKCVPNNRLIPPGGAIICNITLSQTSIALGTLVSGRLYLTASPCQSGNALNCQSAQPQTYVGHFDTHVSPQLSPTTITVNLMVQNSNQPANGAGDKLTATVRLLGTPLQGVIVNFTINPISAVINPPPLATDGNGNTSTYISSLTTGDVLVTAAFANASATVVVTFITPPSPTSVSTTSTSTTSTSTTSTSTTTITAQFCSVQSWTSTNPYPLGLNDHSCTSSNGHIYCIGGVMGNPSVNSVYYASLSSTGVGTWTTTNAYPLPIYQHSCTSSNGYIYCVGGMRYSSVTSVYYAPILSDNSVGTWTTTNAYPQIISGHSCTSYSSYIYCIGGYSSSAVNSVYYASLSSTGVGTWTTTNAYPISVDYHSCTSSNGYIYCVGGYNTGSAVNSVYYAPILPDHTVGAWTTTNAYPIPIVDSERCDTYNGYIYCIGGVEYASGLSSVYCAPISSTGVGTWTTTNAYPIAITDHRCTSSGDTIYCVGGNAQNYVYYAHIT